MKKWNVLASVAAALTIVASAAYAATHLVAQKEKQFNVSTLKAKIGDSVSFRNDDNFFHNIFSLSSGHAFDLGSYGKGESRSVTLSKEGVIEVECAIHPQMKMTIEVTR